MLTELVMKKPPTVRSRGSEESRTQETGGYEEAEESQETEPEERFLTD